MLPVAHLRFWCNLIEQATPVGPWPCQLRCCIDASTAQAECLHTNSKGIVVLGYGPGVAAVGEGVIDSMAGLCGIPELEVGPARRYLANSTVHNGWQLQLDVTVLSGNQ